MKTPKQWADDFYYSMSDQTANMEAEDFFEACQRDALLHASRVAEVTNATEGAGYIMAYLRALAEGKELPAWLAERMEAGT